MLADLILNASPPDNFNELIKSVMQNTNYSIEESARRLQLANYDNKCVIFHYLKGDDVDVNYSTSSCVGYTLPTVSLNQEIFRQVRIKMNDGIRDYNKKQDVIGDEQCDRDDGLSLARSELTDPTQPR